MIIIAIALLFSGVLVWLLRTIRAYRAGKLVPDVPGSVRRSPSNRGVYSIVEDTNETFATVRVERANGDIVNTWIVDMAAPTAEEDLARARADAQAMIKEFGA